MQKVPVGRLVELNFLRRELMADDYGDLNDSAVELKSCCAAERTKLSSRKNTGGES